MENIEEGFREFWTHDCKLNLDTNVTPPIPSEGLLNHFGRYDLKNAIVPFGREELAERLGGAEIIPGRWSKAVNESAIVKELLKVEGLGLSPDLPPLSPQRLRQLREKGETSVIEDTQERKERQWRHSENRKHGKYWTLPLVVEHLYKYLDECPARLGRPSCWMPRPAETGDSHPDLMLAIAANGGAKRISKVAGLVPYREWSYFEGQLELLVDLNAYKERYHPEEEAAKWFPFASHIRENGYENLYILIQRYGGRKFLASRYGLHASNQGRSAEAMKNGPLLYGRFDLKFAIDLLVFIRELEMKKKPPLARPTIDLPSHYILKKYKREDLVRQIEEFGGSENVARRLGLEWEH